MTGRMIASSSRPSAPFSPACGLSPAIASRGRSSPKARVQISRRYHAGAIDEVWRQLIRHVLQRDVDRDGDGAQLRPGKQHDRQDGLPRRLLGKVRQVFRMAGKAEAGIVKNRLGDRVGYDCGGFAGGHKAHCGVDRADDGAGIGGVGIARCDQGRAGKR